MVNRKYRLDDGDDDDDIHDGHHEAPKSAFEKFIQGIIYLWNALKYCVLLPYVLIKRRLSSRHSNATAGRRRRHQDDSRGLLTRNSTDEGEIYDLLADSDQHEDTLFDDIELNESVNASSNIKNRSSSQKVQQSALHKFLYGVMGKEPSVPSHITNTPAAKLLYQLEQLYGKDHPRFFTSGLFVKARKLARQKKKLLLLYVHAQEHNSTDAFCKEVLFTPSFKDFVNSHFIPYLTPIHSSEGHALIQELNIHAFPSLVVLRCRKSKIQRIGCVPAKMGSSSTAREAMIQQLLHHYEHHGMLLLSEDTPSSTTMTTTPSALEQSSVSEIAVQDAAFAEALRRDQEAEAEAKRKEEEEREEAEAAEEALLIQEAQKLSIDETRQRLRTFFNDNEPSKDIEDTSLVQFRFPDGSARSHRFLNSDLVRRCYEYIDCLDNLDDWSPRDDALWDDYELSTAFPKTVLDPSLTIGASNISNQIIRVVDLKA